MDLFNYSLQRWEPIDLAQAQRHELYARLPQFLPQLPLVQNLFAALLLQNTPPYRAFQEALQTYLVAPLDPSAPAARRS